MPFWSKEKKSRYIPGYGLLGSRGHTKRRHLGVLVVRDNGATVTGALGEFTSISKFEFDITAHSSLRHGSERKHVTDSKLSLASGVDKLPRIHAFTRDVKKLIGLELVRILEVNLSQRSSSTGFVNDLLHASLGVSLAISVIKRFHLDRSLSELGV